MIDLAEYKSKNKKAVEEDTSASDSDVESLTPEQIHEKLIAKHPKFKADTLENLPEVYKSFPLLEAASEEMRASALEYVFWHKWHESVAVICHDNGQYKYSKVREKYEGVKDDSGALHKGARRKGKKWIFGPCEKAYPFAPALFWQNYEFDTVVVCEGEKDAINLFLLGIPAITLGGAGERWGKHLDFFKGEGGAVAVPKLIVWYDNDEAGRIGAKYAYKDLVTLFGIDDVSVVDWAKLDSFATEKDDATDFILSKAGLTKEELMTALTKASGKPKSSKEWAETSAMLLSKTTPLKSRTQDEISVAVAAFMASLNDSGLERFVNGAKDLAKKDKDVMERLQEIEDLAEVELKEEIKELNDKKLEEAKKAHFVKKFFGATAMANFLKHTTSDGAKEIIDLCEQNGVHLMQHHAALFFWCGTHYQILEDWELSDFFIDWMKKAKVNIKQSHNVKQFKSPILESILGLQKSINGYKAKLKGLSYVNHQGGTLFIDNSGRIRQKSHNAKDGITYCLPFAYTPSAKAKEWQKFLDSSVPEKESQMILQEFIGYLFLNNYSARKFLYLFGMGANGKSVFIDIIKSLFDAAQISHLEVSDMENHNLDAFDDKILNISTEIEAGGYVPKQISLLKKMVSGEALQVNPKHDKTYVNYEPPKFVMSGNDMLKGGGMNDALNDRMLLIPFDQRITEEKRDVDLASRIIENELPGVLNWALDGAQRLISQRYKFTVSMKVAEVAEEYKEETDPIHAYIKQAFEMRSDKPTPTKNHDIWIPTGPLYIHFTQWCKMAGVKEPKQQIFTRILTAKMETTADKKTASMRFIIGFKCVSELSFDVSAKNELGNSVISTMQGRALNNYLRPGHNGLNDDDFEKLKV